ncbi:hypothetical protein [Gracilimonas mengyeensis]|uniref:Uncharacterized protein n=1 Tax=Gracilimonas mengyeensis TaxID=1302730 RepID=A0A521EDR6_9BACT|nr:hypothetical protein [Gracilimonas mengyeensis]SMO82059.1 hypothetical protein SAMN06265219_111123 [Gracilimonas mengyeensis]
MNDYSDIIYLMGAMIIFSMLSLNVSHFFRINEQFQYQNEIEYNGVALAQDIIEEVRWISDPDRITNGNQDCICNDYPQTITREFGPGQNNSLDFTVDLTITDVSVPGSNAVNKRIEVMVTNEYLPDNQVIEMEYIKSYIE